MIPANIISGFITCGVYPFNPKAVLDHDPCVSKNNNPKSTDGNNPTNGDLLSGSDSLPKRLRKKCPTISLLAAAYHQHSLEVSQELKLL